MFCLFVYWVGGGREGELCYGMLLLSKAGFSGKGRFVRRNKEREVGLINDVTDTSIRVYRCLLPVIYELCIICSSE